MREPPRNLATDELRDCLRREYGLPINVVAFLPLGHDAAAWAYRAEAADGTAYFVKVRLAITNEAALIVPHYLVERGVTDVVAPLTTVAGALWTKCSTFAVIVYPFISSSTGMQIGMSDAQWVAYGAALRQIHDAPLTDELQRQMRHETFAPDGAASIRRIDELVESDVFDDAGRSQIAAFWKGQRDTIRDVLASAQELGRRVGALGLPAVLCHADIHTNNVLVGGSDRIWIADWDETTIAPRERDLMFVMGGIHRDFVSNREEQLFLEGYGAVDVNSNALAYYRYAWAVSDIGAYAEQVYLRPDLGALDQREAVERLESLFDARSIVAIARASVIGP